MSVNSEMNSKEVTKERGTHERLEVPLPLAQPRVVARLRPQQQKNAKKAHFDLAVRPGLGWQAQRMTFVMNRGRLESHNLTRHSTFQSKKYDLKANQ